MFVLTGNPKIVFLFRQQFDGQNRSPLLEQSPHPIHSPKELNIFSLGVTVFNLFMFFHSIVHTNNG